MLGEPREQKPACADLWHRAVSLGWDGWVSWGLGFLAKRGSNEKRIDVNKAKPGNSALSPYFCFSACKFYVFAEQMQMRNLYLSPARPEVLGNIFPGVNMEGLGKPLSMPFPCASLSG